MKKLFLLCLLIPTVSFAQTYTIDWYKISGGGGVSTGGVYSVTGTIGQHDVGSAMTGGAYSLTGGFWSLIAVVQAAGLPTLSISHAGNSVLVSWPDTGGYILQQNNNLSEPSAWSKNNNPMTTSNGTNSITITPPAGNLFLRLANP